MKTPKTVAVIPARAGSRGIPGKNIVPLGAKPLIAWTIDAAAQSPSLHQTIVSTDDEHIARVARQYGANVPFLRPAALATDTCTNVDVVLHALDWFADDGINAEYVMLLQPTSPFRTTQDIENVIALAMKSDADGVVSIAPVEQRATMVFGIAPEGHLQQACNFCGNDAAYSLNGAIFLVRSEILKTQRNFIPKRTLSYIMSRANSLDIDEPADLRIAEFRCRAPIYSIPLAG